MTVTNFAYMCPIKGRYNIRYRFTLAVLGCGLVETTSISSVIGCKNLVDTVLVKQAIKRVVAEVYNSLCYSLQKKL